MAKFCNGRGTAEPWIKEGEYAVKWTRLSCRNFTDNQGWFAATEADLA